MCTDGKVRLSSPSSQLIGRVDVCVNGTWSTICDDHWTNTDAIVICRQLGHSTYGNNYFRNSLIMIAKNLLLSELEINYNHYYYFH